MKRKSRSLIVLLTVCTAILLLRHVGSRAQDRENLRSGNHGCHTLYRKHSRCFGSILQWPDNSYEQLHLHS